MNDSGGNDGRARRRRAGLVLATGAGAFALTSAAVLACSAKHDAAPGEILLAIDTNLRVSGDVDTIGLSVSLGDGTHVTEDAMFPLAPVGNAMFPATLAIVRGTTQPIKIRVVGYQQGNPISLRDTVTTIPADRTALLRMDINWLDEGSVMTPPATTTVSSLTSLLCPDGQTSVGGGCTSYTLDSASLGTFDPEGDLVSSAGPQCFDVLSCFASPSVMTVPTPPASDCTLEVPATAAGDNVNIGLNVTPGHGGWCGAAGCVVPLEKDPAEGWTLSTAGRLQLPKGACTNPLVQSIAVLVNDCATYSPAHPACESYGDGGTTAPPDATAGDATVPHDGAVADASSDAAMTVPDSGRADAADSAALPSYTYSPTHTVLTFAVSETRLYALTTINSVYFLQAFPRGQPGLGTTPAPIGYMPPESSAALMVATGSTVALTANQGDRSTLVEMLTVAADGTLADAGVLQTTGAPTSLGSLGIEPLVDGGVRVFAASLTTTEDFCWRDVGGATSCTTANDGRCLAAAIDPTSGAYVIEQHSFANAGVALGQLRYGTLDPTVTTGGALTLSQIVMTTPPGLEGLGFADPQHVAFLDSAGRVGFASTTQDNAAATILADAAVPAPSNFTAGSNHIAWITGANLAVFMTTLDNGVPGPVQAVDSGGAINQVLINGADLFWTDGVSVYSIPL